MFNVISVVLGLVSMEQKHPQKVAFVCKTAMLCK